ncbi:epidermal retinol dehydrogenase 2 [Nematolebias whitei]|uniref:epidermal retinol dehydrogenase 2 n=1 Tax=Nematolebias whitei TaxID=451745 RepID=UPI001897912B|nr:epidermal retinol dehydrogenase 2 [Nematolebias whitei]
MNFFLETLQVIILSFWYNLESLFFFLVPRKKKNISGEVVLITGAGSGIGRLMAREFAALGTVLVLWDINEEGVKETARIIKSSGASRVHCFVCDCSDKKEVYRVAEQVKREVGDISILVNNAGIVTGKKFMDSPDSLIEKTMEVNTMAHFWTYKAFLPAMIANNHGHLVSIASSAGLIGVNGLAAHKWPRVLPILNAEIVAKKIIHAVLTDQVYLLLPKSMYFIAGLKNILPMKQGLLLGQYLGAFNLMDTFRGRSKKQE